VIRFLFMKRWGKEEEINQKAIGGYIINQKNSGQYIGISQSNEELRKIKRTGGSSSSPLNTRKIHRIKKKTMKKRIEKNIVFNINM